MSHDAPFIPARDHAQRSFAVPCEGCERWTEQTLEQARLDPARAAPQAAPGVPAVSASCAGCGREQRLAFDQHVDSGGRLDGCPRCGYHTLCIQKDVNPRFGVILVAVTFGALFFSGLPIPYMLVGLVLLASLDWLLLRTLVKRLLICYRCKAQYRGFAPGPGCRPFDLATWEAHTPPKEG